MCDHFASETNIQNENGADIKIYVIHSNSAFDLNVFEKISRPFISCNNCDIIICFDWQICNRSYDRSSVRFWWWCDTCCAYLWRLCNATQYHESWHRRSRCHTLPPAATTKRRTQLPHICWVRNCQNHQRGGKYCKTSSANI